MNTLNPETKLTYVTLLADPSIHPKYESALEQVEIEFGKHHPLIINGRKVLAGEGEFDVRSPLDTKILLGYFQKGTAKHARKAIEAGKDAFEEWGRKPWKERVAIIRRAADLMEDDRFKLAALITYEVGKNRYEAVAEANRHSSPATQLCFIQQAPHLSRGSNSTRHSSMQEYHLGH